MISGEALDVELRPEEMTHVILAYSVSTDYDHHSRWRGAVNIDL